MTVDGQRVRILDWSVNANKKRFEFLTEVGTRRVKFNRVLTEVFMHRKHYESL